MKRLITLCIVLTAVALIAAPAFAEVQNVKVSGDINSAGVYRTSYDMLSTNQGGDDVSQDNSFLYTQARVRIDADLTDNVSTTVRFLTEYDWNTQDNTGSNNEDDVDLDLANVTLKEVFYAPLTVTIGRQELRLGNAFIVGDPDTNAACANAEFTAQDLSLRKSFDAIKAVLDYDPLVVSLIYSKIEETADRLLDASPSVVTGDDEDLYGINAAYDIGNYNSEVEAYFLLNRDNDETNTTGDEIYVYGLRGSATPIDNLNVLAEIAWQRGDFEGTAATKRDQDAMAYQLAADYAFADVTIPGVNIGIVNPTLKIGWTHYDGEEYATTGITGDQQAWIPLYEDQTHGMVANYLLAGVNGGQNSNANILNIGGSIAPIEDLTLSVDYYHFTLDEKLATAGSTQASTNAGLAWTNLDEADYWLDADDYLGYEIDIALNYDYSEDVKMGLCFGLFNPGDAFDGADGNSDNSEAATQVLATLDVAF